MARLLCSPLRALAGPPHDRLRPRPSRGGAASARPCRRRARPEPGTASARELRDAGPDSTWHIWLEPLEPRGSTAATLVRRGARPTSARGSPSASAACCRPAPARVLGPDDAGRARRAPGARRRRPRRAAEHATAADDASTPSYTFDQFVIGDSNRLAHAAALAVAELPGLAYNPLFICGPPGLGKTHLLHSIANYVSDYGDGLTVRYTTVEAFTNHFVGALHGGGIEAFKARLPRRRRPARRRRPVPRRARPRPSEEFFHTFNALHEAGAPARAHLRPPPARPAAARGPPARALRGRPRRRRRAARLRHAPDDPAQARRCRTASATSTPTALERDRRPRRPPTSARSRAR